MAPLKRHDRSLAQKPCRVRWLRSEKFEARKLGDLLDDARHPRFLQRHHIRRGGLDHRRYLLGAADSTFTDIVGEQAQIVTPPVFSARPDKADPSRSRARPAPATSLPGDLRAD